MPQSTPPDPASDRDERVSLAPLDPEEALRALLAVPADDKRNEEALDNEDPES